jgi:dTDP-4-dehydrorhamnose 3,5-epimerase
MIRSIRRRLTLEFRRTSLHDVTVIEPEPMQDERGWFVRVFAAVAYRRAGIDHTELVQENQSRSRRRTIRGLHTRSRLGEDKLVRCARGEIYDVVVDLRPFSPTFLRWADFRLDDRAHHQIYIPAGCAHGFQALSEFADVCYRVSAYYDASLDVSIAWDDAELAIPWPLDRPILSERDRHAPALSEIRPRLAEWFGTPTA